MGGAFNGTLICASSGFVFSLFVLLTHIWPSLSYYAFIAGNGRSLFNGIVSLFRVRRLESPSAAWFSFPLDEQHRIQTWRVVGSSTRVCLYFLEGRKSTTTKLDLCILWIWVRPSVIVEILLTIQFQNILIVSCAAYFLCPLRIMINNWLVLWFHAVAFEAVHTHLYMKSVSFQGHVVSWVQ